MAIAEQTGVTTDDVRAALAAAGVRAETRLDVRLDDGAWLQHRIDQGSTSAMIATELGCSASSVRAAAAQVGARWKGKLRHPQLHDRQWLTDRLAIVSKASIAAELGCSISAVNQAAQRVGIRSTTAAIRPWRYPLLEDRGWLEQRYVSDRRTVSQLAAEAGCSLSSVVRALDRHTIRRRRVARYPQLHDHGWLRDQFAVRSAQSIADEIGCTPDTVTSAARRAGITAAERAQPNCYPQLHDRAWLRLRYNAASASIASIAAELGCGQSTVRRALRRLALDRAGPGTRFAAQLGDRTWLLTQRSQGRTIVDIAAEVGVDRSTVAAALRRHGLRTGPRPLEQRVRHDWNRTGNLATVARWNDLTQAAARRLLVEIGVDVARN